MNPRRRIADIVSDLIIVHKTGEKKDIWRMLEELLQLVDLPPDFMYRYPHMLSGGQKQRVVIARALSLEEKPKASKTELEGGIPSPTDIPSGCVFRTRCRFAMEVCKTALPVQTRVNEGHAVACHLCPRESQVGAGLIRGDI